MISGLDLLQQLKGIIWGRWVKRRYAKKTHRGERHQHVQKMGETVL